MSTADAAPNENRRTTSFIETQLQREILANEILRSSILLGVFFLLGVSLSLVPILLPEVFQRVTQGAVRAYYPPGFFGSVCLFFFLVRRRLLILRQQDRPVPLFAQYLNAFVETSIPTLAILSISMTREPAIIALNLPPTHVYFIFIILSGLRLNKRLCYFTGAVAGAQYLAVAIWIQSRTTIELDPGLSDVSFHIAKALLYIVGGVLTGWVTERNKSRLIEGFNAQEERNHVTGVFGQHVSPAVVDELLRRGARQVESQLREVCVLFFDIRSFTSYSESRSPGEIFAYLNQVFSVCIEAVNANDGIINKFLGDGFMAVFGAPLSSGADTANALRAVRIIRESLAEKFPETRFGMGLHSGFAVTGNVGSTVRQEYTIIGDVVNVAARIEQLTKEFKCQILISQDALERAAQTHPETVADAVDLGPVTIKGRQGETHIYRLN
ncbi:MAG: adenylate/guanylate cyclase domain-containing protein [bacterium]|nr:adenylate/guanylate cyclase domain-containing protein [bacterium]